MGRPPDPLGRCGRRMAGPVPEAARPLRIPPLRGDPLPRVERSFRRRNDLRRAADVPPRGRPLRARRRIRHARAPRGSTAGPRNAPARAARGDRSSLWGALRPAGISSGATTGLSFRTWSRSFRGRRRRITTSPTTRGGAATSRARRRHLERAVELFPRYYDAWASLGRIAWAEKRWDDAVTCYRKSVEIMPGLRERPVGPREDARGGRADGGGRRGVGRGRGGRAPVVSRRVAPRGLSRERRGASTRRRRNGGGRFRSEAEPRRPTSRSPASSPGKGGSAAGTESWKEARRALVADPANAATPGNS